ncbi:septal ring lytic transglycosylase RlpA family protein [Roseomonas sp. AR75]|uniref:septal ring lytic transglycosylase RlpA family protein n=1 Tax=Roseomonas sp. AR75 TaxID=2562311 RepID=UPI0010BF9B8F|nr:septal ring lytic transglycosylase RlpA family protein [Roseomonas sp. AR75]
MRATPWRRIPSHALLALVLLAPFQAKAFEPQEGGAAIYAKRFNGRPMANGRPFDPAASHAAHRHLPFGTVAEVINLRNGARTRVVISDRGPFTPGRIIDLSPRSARELGINGVGRVEIRPVVDSD